MLMFIVFIPVISVTVTTRELKSLVPPKEISLEVIQLKITTCIKKKNDDT